MTTRLLPRQIDETARGPALRLWGDVRLATGRAHEACGGARRSFAMLVAGAMTGSVLWIQPGWVPGRLNGAGMVGFADPGRFLFVYPRRPEDVLWTMEEALRSGAVPLVVADLVEAPGLTPVRRLHLAAEAGGRRPLGLLLTPGDGGAQGIESRWRLEADHGPGPGWRLSRLRARAEPPQTWRLSAAGGRLALEVSAPGPAPEPAAATAAPPAGPSG
jgi:protein ImuA